MQNDKSEVGLGGAGGAGGIDHGYFQTVLPFTRQNRSLQHIQ